jgi:hypothetical protein
LILPVLMVALLLAVSFFTESNAARAAIVGPMLLLFVLSYFLHKASLSWIRISEDGAEAVSVPSWFGRKLLGEKRVVARIAPGAEMVFCRRFAYGGLQGYYVILRSADRTEQTLWSSAAQRVSRRWWDRIAREIRERYPLNTRLVTQTVSSDGTEEKEWTREGDRIRWRPLKIMIGPMLSPWLGIVIRIFTADPRVIIPAGIFLWITGIALFRHLYRTQRVAKEQPFTATLVFWTIQFIAMYAIAVLLAGAAMNRWFGPHV